MIISIFISIRFSNLSAVNIISSFIIHIFVILYGISVSFFPSSFPVISFTYITVLPTNPCVIYILSLSIQILFTYIPLLSFLNISFFIISKSLRLPSFPIFKILLSLLLIYISPLCSI